LLAGRARRSHDSRDSQCPSLEFAELTVLTLNSRIALVGSTPTIHEEDNDIERNSKRFHRSVESASVMNPEFHSFLVTGATGFVGRHLVPTLIDRFGANSVTAMINERLRPDEMVFLRELKERNVRIHQCDLLELPKLRLSVPEFDTVYHLAAYVETERASPRILVNSEGTRMLLNWLSPNLKHKRVIYTGSLASVDRRRPKGPIREDTPCQPITEYGRTKLEGEQIIAAQSAVMGYDYTILRLPTIIGAGFRAGGMFDVFPRMLRGNSFGTRLNWPGKTSFLCVSDLVKILTEIPRSPQTRNELYVLSNGEDPTFDEFLDCIAKVLDVPRQRVVLPRWFWHLVGMVATFGSDKNFLPHPLRTFCWRVALMVYDGICADASKIDALLHTGYQAIGNGLRESYGVERRAFEGARRMDA
jgi:nucleoside-diphosphate-sugar epimerase